MKTVQFVNGYLKGKAKITIAKENGDIIYSGEVQSLNPTLMKKTTVVNISGLGSIEDIIITVKESNKE